ncbi:hypothetical protein [Streptomyces sp. CoH17]|uniref:hypothetical protein n=1 Tax=Streptomyces sp. CoH17 TaxID=2992806 RepID=UPI0022711928|nr:hypothetical protein [Streptomyces sp. CoH17]
MSDIARPTLFYALSLPNDWVVRKEDFCKKIGYKQASFYKAIAQLRELGYVSGKGAYLKFFDVCTQLEEISVSVDTESEILCGQSVNKTDSSSKTDEKKENSTTSSSFKLQRGEPAACDLPAQRTSSEATAETSREEVTEPTGTVLVGSSDYRPVNSLKEQLKVLVEQEGIDLSEDVSGVPRETGKMWMERRVGGAVYYRPGDKPYPFYPVHDPSIDD